MSLQPADSLSSQERRAGVALAAVFGLRMLGLFLILPVFAVHARSIPGGDDALLVGIALGAYGLTQAFMQIPFGTASDRFGRKPVIVTGLLLFAVGSAIAALAADMQWMIAGRVVQGAGAISAAVTALAADLTREQHRTKVMAMIGSSIGLMFAISLVAAPALQAAVGLSGIFWLTAILAFGAIGLIAFVVPPAPVLPAVAPVPLSAVLSDGRLLRLNLGIFTLHLAQMAMFVVLPGMLVAEGGVPLGDHWRLYLPAVLLSFALMVPAIVMGERRGRVREVMVAAIALLLLTECVFAVGARTLPWLATGLVAFFVAFNILEATLPSLISRVAPPQAKGAALGVYNTTQALGLFAGGALGGALLKWQGAAAVFVACAGLVSLWLWVAWRSPPLPARRVAQTV